MTVSTLIPVTLLMRVGDSGVLNEIGTVEMVLDLVVINEETREPGDAIEAEGRVQNFDLPGALRAFADKIESGT